MTPSSRTAHKAPRSRSKTHRSSVHYSRTSRHSRKSPLFYKHTKTFGAHSLSFPRKLETTHAITGRPPSPKIKIKKFAARDGDARLLPAEPEDLPPARRARAARARRSDARRDGGRARGQADLGLGREPEPVGGPIEEPRPV